MFAAACSIAREFTFPIIISSIKVNGECSSGIGSFVLINDEGWFVTAYHILGQLQHLQNSLNAYNELLAKRKSIEDNLSIKRHEKFRQLNTMKVQPDSITNFSVWPGWDGIELGPTFSLPEIDLAVGQLKNFDKTKIKRYPQFKDPNKPMDTGTSLCKLGFPFHTITPTFDPKIGFILPPGSLPIPLFPLEGIYTRTVEVQTTTPQSFPYRYIETSSPGLRGQSGGPTFDIHGTIWAIQSQTQHLKLGFETNGTGKEIEHLKNQYLNVGWGVHSQTLTGFFNSKGISFQSSSY